MSNEPIKIDLAADNFKMRSELRDAMLNEKPISIVGQVYRYDDGVQRYTLAEACLRIHGEHTWDHMMQGGSSLPVAIVCRYCGTSGKVVQ